MKVRSLVIAACLVGVAYGQTTTGHGARIVSALSSLAESHSAFLELEGDQTVASATAAPTTVHLLSQAYLTEEVDTSVDPVGLTLKVEIHQFRDAKLVSRILGDSKSIWTYHNDRLTYSTDPYGRWGDTPNTNYEKDFYNLLTASSGQELSYLVRVLREAFEGHNLTNSTPRYLSWVPTSVPTDGVAGIDGADDANDVVYKYANPVSGAERTVTFNLSSDDGVVFTLDGIVYHDLKKLGKKTIQTDFKIEVKDFVDVPTYMNFLPYPSAANWKQVVRARPGIQ